MMHRIKFYAESKWSSHLLSVWVTSIMALVHFGLGCAVIFGGKERFVRPTYEPLINMVDGHTWIWGISIMLSAVLMVTPFKWPIVAGLGIGMLWMYLWTAAFTVSVLQYDNTAATPVPVYGGLALINVALLAAKVLDKKME